MSLVLSSTGKELREKFFSLNTPQDVAELLEIEYRNLVYHLYIVPEPERYTTFRIPKKSGGARQISTPVTALKIIQQKLNQVLRHVYQPKAPVHGFVHGKNIVTNARMHVRQRYVLNVDLQDFFPSINFGRVRGMFMAVPYERDPAVATILAQICCFRNELPQGAPTSPIVSNMICAKMDSQLRRLAQAQRCIYTRYADDITLSTSMPTFPSILATVSPTGQVKVGAGLKQLIHDNGFEVNPSKIRLQTRDQRQEVTGLTTNRFPNVKRQYVRQIRAMLHAWEKFGLEAAEKEFRRKYDKKHRSPQKEEPSFKQVVKGKIEFLGMVRGKNDQIYRRFRDELRVLAPDLVREFESDTSIGTAPLIMTEGKTDWMHLKAALVRLQELGFFQDLDIEFQECEEDRGDSELKDYCKRLSKDPDPRPRPIICIFDRDNPRTLKEVSGRDTTYKEWGNGVFSFAIPVPSHRQDAPEVCIELYYKDSEIMRFDRHGRRLFLSSEFDARSSRHKEDSDLSCNMRNKIRRSQVTIIDNEVFNKDHENVALAKSSFADYVLNQVENFDNFDFSEFREIFSIISMIVGHHRHRN